MPGKIILFIASEKGYTAFSAVVMQNYAHKIGAVVTFKETDVAKSWDNDIREECIHSKIPFYFWADIKNNMFAVMQEHDCKYAVTISWKYLLPVEINKYLKYPPIVFHDSLLPKYRGSAPINWAILNGEKVTGVTIQRMVRDMDAGDVILQQAVKIGKTEDAAALYDRLAQLGGELAVEAVAQIQAGTATYTPQDHTQATQAPRLSKAMSPVDWTRSAQEIFNHIRGLYPWPGASTTAITGEPIKLWVARVVEQHTDALPGTVIAADWGGIDMACGDGQVLRVLELQAPGKKRMTAAAYLAGNPIQVC